MFKSIIKSNLKVFIKDKSCIISYLLLIVSSIIPYIIITAIKFINNSFNFTDPSIGDERFFLYLAPVLFLSYIFISYIFFTKTKRDSCYECISLYNESNTIIAQLIIMICAAVLSSTLIVVFFYSFCHNTFPMDIKHYLYILRLDIYYFMLADIIAILFGLICSFFKKSVSYCLMIAISVFTSPLQRILSEIIEDITYYKLPLYKFLKFFTFYPLELKYNNLEFGFSNGINHLFMALMWISFLSLIIFFKLKVNSKNLKKVIISICIVVLIPSVVLSLQPYSEPPFYRSDSTVGWNSEYNYYLPYDDKNTPIQIEKTAEFKVNSYDMIIDTRNQVNAKVKINLDKNNLNEYDFTLFHEFKINKILDSNNNELKFNQQNDYVTVYTDAPIDSLTFIYKGLCPTYHCNSNSICLPAGFAYYPISGLHYLYNINQQGIILIETDNPVEFNVTFKNEPKKVYSNLEKMSEHQFKGISTGATFVSSFSLKEINIEDTKIIYYSDIGSNDYIKNNISEQIKNGNYKGKTIITVFSYTNGYDSNKHVFSDHITLKTLFELDGLQIDEDEKEKSIVGMSYYYKVLSFNDKNSQVYKYYKMITNNDIDDYKKNTLQSDIDYIIADRINEYGWDYIKHQAFNLSVSNSSIWKFDSPLDLAKISGDYAENEINKYFDRDRG